jgi:membrane protein required for colicin V production
MAVSLTDWVLLGVLLASMVVGLWRGLVYEVLSLAGWVAAFVVAQWLAADVVGWLPFVKGAPASVQYAVAFAVVFVATVFAAGLVSWLIKKLVETVGLRPVDRTLGGLFGLARGVVLLLALTVVVQLTGLSKDAWWSTAQGSVWLEIVLTGLKPLLPQTFVDYLP